jgi:protein-S-isoprenylcysteine O-methyltransferase Ste14
MIKAFKAKRLLTTGPFAVCRNPMYSTLFFMVVPGLSLILNMWLILLEIPILSFIFFKNIEEEENYLLKEFNDDYTNYKNHVTRLIPKVL